MDEITSNKKGESKRTVNVLLYCSHTLSAWGDRMWQFAVGMFLVTIDPTSLRLTAIYGFVSGGTILFVGAILGNWVDKKPRLKVALSSILQQNLCVSISAICVMLWIYYEDLIKSMYGGAFDILLQVLIILFAVLADVGSVARTISIERDWIVVICDNKQGLTDMSAFLRSIDLTTNLLAPIVTGQVMTYGSISIGAIFIAAWNLIFSFVEFAFLYSVYKKVPELANKKTANQNKFKETEDEKSPLLSSNEQNHARKSSESNRNPDKGYSNKSEKVISQNENDPGSNNTENKQNIEQNKNESSSKVYMLFFDTFIVLYRGWRTYIKQDIVYAGLALAFLYMTVLGFDNITMGYAKQQGLTESLISILLAAGAVVGVLGTFAFPYMRKSLGIQRTGLVSFALEVICLSLCVLSVFSPGSPFDPEYLINGRPEALQSCSDDDDNNITESFNLSTFIPCDDVSPVVPESFTSIIILMVGIIISRFGLWTSDLTVTQLLLETPPEHERGIINGVQSSLNKLMDILKALLVLLLPWPQTFGYLVIVSFVFVFAGAILFALYSRKVRGHLFHFDQMYEDKIEKLQQSPSNALFC